MEIGFVLKDGATLPSYKTEGASGADICALLDGPVTIPSMSRALIPTGVFAEIPEGCELQVRPRSGLALKNGVTVLNSPGTIDSDYRGEIGVVLANFGDEPFVVRNGDRIAQLVVASVQRASFALRNSLSATARGEGGYGSTGRA